MIYIPYALPQSLLTKINTVSIRFCSGDSTNNAVFNPGVLGANEICDKINFVFLLPTHIMPVHARRTQLWIQPSIINKESKHSAHLTPDTSVERKRREYQPNVLIASQVTSHFLPYSKTSKCKSSVLVCLRIRYTNIACFLTKPDGRIYFAQDGNLYSDISKM